MDTSFNKVSKKAGLMPGTPVFVGEKKADEVRITVIDYDEEHFDMKELKRIEECSPYKDKTSVSWINIDGLHEAELIQELGTYYGWHPLVVEDILNTNQRTKTDIFDDYIFISLKMLTYNRDAGTLGVEQLSLIAGEGYVITFQEMQGDIFDPVRQRIKNSRGRIRKVGADYLAYSLIDAVVDNYFKVLEYVGEEIEGMEDELLTNPTPDVLQNIHGLKREMIYLRRSVWPLREIVNELQREDTPLIRDTTSIYLRDLYDHIIQVMDTVETFRDMISGMMDVYLSSISNRMNEVMKVLTIFAAIFIPLTFIAGIYGMNFNPDKSPFNMPELNWYLGYPFVIGVMIVVGVGMLYYFKRKKWL